MTSVRVGDSANCCSGSHSTAATCPPNDVDDYSYFSTWPLHLGCLPSLERLYDYILCSSRGELSEDLRLCLRREQRHRSLDVQFQPQCRLSSDLLSVRALFHVLQLCPRIHVFLSRKLLSRMFLSVPRTASAALLILRQ